jgi:hypothetical protein
MVMRNICAIYSLLALGYVAFRYFSEIKGKKYKFIEYILGNYTPSPKNKKVKPSKEMIKKNRELENGTLEPKPITMQVEQNVESLASANDLSANANDEEVSKEEQQTNTTNQQEEDVSVSQQSTNAFNTTNSRSNYWG